MMEAWHLLKNEEDGGLLHLPAFPLIIKPWPLSSRHGTPLPSCLYLSQRSILINSFLTCHSASCWILSMPRQKSLCSTKAWNAFCGFKMNRGARLEPGAHPHKAWCFSVGTMGIPRALWGTASQPRLATVNIKGPWLKQAQSELKGLGSSSHRDGFIPDFPLDKLWYVSAKSAWSIPLFSSSVFLLIFAWLICPRLRERCCGSRYYCACVNSPLYFNRLFFTYFSEM